MGPGYIQVPCSLKMDEDRPESSGEASSRSASTDSGGDSHRSKRRRVQQPEVANALLPAPTEEQQRILESAFFGGSFRVVANAGTGKTRTLLRAASTLQKKVLFLAYNRDIKEEVQNLVEIHGLTHVDVENYDSLLVNYYDSRAASQDFQLSLQRILDEGDRAKPLKEMMWEAVFVDEAQDMDDSYLRFVQKVLSDNLPTGEVQMVSVGDPKQNIFRYRGADSQYFMKTGLHAVGTSTLTLSTTFRFGREVCSFVDAVCAPLFPQDYLGHDSGAPDLPGGVEHWVLSGDPGVSNEALIVRLQELRGELERRNSPCPEERLLAFLSGSKREGNDALWSFVEEVGCYENASEAYYGLVVEDAAEVPSDGAALAFVRNVHCCKGKTFEVAVLFVTTRRSWIDFSTGQVEKEALYVALTRSKRLLVVECDDTLIFQEVLTASLGENGNAALPRARCAHSGMLLTVPLEKQKWGGGRSFSKPFLDEKLGKLGVLVKKQLLELIAAPPLCEWQEGSSSEASSKDVLHALAAWTRLEHVQTEDRSRFNAFFDALRRKDVEKAYAHLWRSRRRRPISRCLRKRLQALADKETLTEADYLDAVRLHPIFQYGYLALPDVSLNDLERTNLLFRSIEKELERLGERQKIFEVRFKSGNIGDVQNTTIEHGLYLANDVVVMIKAENATSESLNDRLLAAYVCAHLNAEGYELRYVPLDQNRVVRSVQGRVLSDKRLEYVTVFESAVGAL